jgi:hypothetical protein
MMNPHINPAILPSVGPEGRGNRGTFGGIGYTCHGLTIIQPEKQPPARELSPLEKADNRAISPIRLCTEHMICAGKRYPLVKEKIRLM